MVGQAWGWEGRSGGQEAVNIYSLGGRTVAIKRDSELTYVFQDHLGSPALETDVDGTTGSRWTYEPYGIMRASEWTLPIDRGFTGQVIEQGLGLHDYGARHYAQPLGRWIAPDMIVPDPANPQSLNRYSYTLGNPVRYIDPTGHQACLAWAPIPYIALPCQVVEQIALHGPEIVNLIQQLTVSAPQIPAIVDSSNNPVTSGSSVDGGLTSDPGGLDPNDFDRIFRSMGERYQYETSGTRFGEETRLSVRIRGAEQTIDVDGIFGRFLHESKFVDRTSQFYTTQIGKLGTGLQIHVSGWRNQLERLSLAAQQHGYEGVKVFVNDEEAIRIATEMFGTEDWFGLIQFIYQAAQ